MRLHTNQNIDEIAEHSAVYNKWNNFTAAIGNEGEDQFYQFGTEENRIEIKKRMEKLVLSIELGAWDKAEALAETLKTLIESSDGDLKKLFLRMGMAVRKENYEKSMEMYGQVKQALIERMGEL